LPLHIGQVGGRYTMSSSWNELGRAVIAWEYRARLWTWL